MIDHTKSPITNKALYYKYNNVKSMKKRMFDMLWFNVGGTHSRL
jgi:hypothetical protein